MGNSNSADLVCLTLFYRSLQGFGNLAGWAADMLLQGFRVTIIP